MRTRGTDLRKNGCADLRSAGQLALNDEPVEPDNPFTSYLYDRYPRLAGLLNQVLGRFRITLYIDLLEAHPIFRQVTLRSLAPRARGRAEQYYLRHFDSFKMRSSSVSISLKGTRCSLKYFFARLHQEQVEVLNKTTLLILSPL
jgi:hypothetical protein